MKQGIIIVLVSLFVLAALSVSAEEITLDVDSAVQLALQNNLGLQAEMLDLETAKRAKQNSWNEFLPSIDIGTDLIHSDTGQNTATTESSPWNISAGIRASLPLSTANGYSITNTKLAYEAEDLSLEAVEKQLERDVKKAFYFLIVLDEVKKIIEQNIETAQKRYDQAKTNYDNGLVPELTMLNALVTLENLKPGLEEAEVNCETAEMQFKQAIGIDRKTSLIISFAEGTIERTQSLALEVESLIDEYLSTRLDVQSKEKNIQMLENQKKLTSAEEYTPVLSLSYSYTTGLNDPFNADWGSAGNWSQNSTFGISLSIPIDSLIPGSSSYVKVKEIDDSIEKARIELSDIEQLAEVEIASIILSLEKSQRNIDVLEQNVVLAQKTYDLNEREFNMGVVDLLGVEEAYNRLQEAKLSVLEEKYNYLSGLFDLEYALNTDLAI
jgi:outer membrane protein TolC